eukprot:snap_masked-scaffold_11-processed-gene-11.21-mRNA-1 protein AED:0.09 eAED:0.09 QI:0/0/0/0.5/1/1/2/0/330
MEMEAVGKFRIFCLNNLSVSNETLSKSYGGFNTDFQSFDYKLSHGHQEPRTELEQFFILDARSQVATIGNRAFGRGTENPNNYPGATLAYLSIDNIHVLRTVFEEISWIQGEIKDLSPLFKQVQSVLKGAVKLVDIVELQGCSALVHCSDGWDRTSQLSSLAMLLMDSFYRTRKGFAILIEKEWMSFGHKFGERYAWNAVTSTAANGTGGNGSDQASPVFSLWLVAVYQILSQFPTAFEFNEAFLLNLFDACFLGQYGNFFANSEKERYNLKLQLRMDSVWSFLLNKPEYVNKNYFAVERCLLPLTSLSNFNHWDNNFKRFNLFESCTKS